MRLSLLLRKAGIEWKGRDVEVTSVTEDSRKVVPGAVFFAFKGFSTDGNFFVNEALKKGAVAVITDSTDTFKKLSGRIPVIFSREARKILSRASAAFYGNPEKELKVIGITGTNGKTTTAYLLFTVLNRLSVKCGIISTVEWGTRDELAPSSMTTPSPTELFKKLSLLKKRGCEFTVMEVSSHGLELERVEPIEFHGAVFTNLSRDHLDFHRDIYSYFLAKEKLFFRSCTSSINADDSFGKVLLGLKGIFPGSLVSYGKEGDFKLISFSKGLLRFELNGKTYKLPTDLKGEFNAYNILAALSLLVAIGFDIEELLPLWRKIRVPGRLEEAAPGVFIDYAHTPDALEKVLKALRKESKGRLITVFGCGGDRDRGKRPQMGKIAEEFSDAVVVTSDNPRSEPPERIAEEILSGMKEAEKAVVILDREEAIKHALRIKKEGDTVLIAGKGHETYQEIKGVKYHFNDRKVVEQFYGNR